MKKLVQTTDAVKKPNFSLIDEKFLKSRIYTIRGLRVMLDADLAEIYGYSTKRFNEQVKNNIEKFDDDFRFQLTSDEVTTCSRSKKSTSSWGGQRYAPYAFTEQGIYMHCSQGSASSKDGGNRIMTIMQVECPDVYHTLVDSLSFTRPLDP